MMLQSAHLRSAFFANLRSKMQDIAVNLENHENLECYGNKLIQ